MKIGVVGGGGAMGGLFGGYLSLAGHEVTLVDVSEAAVGEINGKGLKIEEKDGTVRTVPVPATTDPGSVGPVDAVIVFVKCYHTDAAIAAAVPMIGPETVVLSLQNGWGNADRISEQVGRERVLVGITYHSATLVAGGHVRHPGSGMTFIGELDGAESARLKRIADALRSAGLEVTESTRIVEEVWKKLALNVCTLPTSALLGFFAHQLNQFEGTTSLMRALLSEVVHVAAAKGIVLDEAERWDTITGLLSRGVGAKASMLQDVEGRRQTEIDVINGAIVAAGRSAGVPTPINDTMVWLITSMQEAYAARSQA